MNTKQTATTFSNGYVPKVHRSYSIDEILAAGGTTAFASKKGKMPENLDKKLETLSADALLTNEEFNKALETLNSGK